MEGRPLVNRLQGIVKKGAKQKPVPVRIVSEAVNSVPGKKPGGVDKWEAQDALRTLQRAAEIQGNKPLMRAAKAEAKAMMKQLDKVCTK